MDIRLRYLMSFFKGMYKASEDFNIYDSPEQDNMQEDADENDI